MLFLSRQLLFLKEIRLSPSGTNFIKNTMTNSCSPYLKEPIRSRKLVKKNENGFKKSKAVYDLFQNEDTLCSRINTVNIHNEPPPRELSKSDTISDAEILCRYPEKVQALSEHLQCSQDTAVGLIKKYNFLMKSSMDSIIPKIHTLLDSGITKDELLNDLWILTYTVPTIEKRLNLLKELSLSPVKPWLIRCSSHLLTRMSKNRENNRIAMGSYKTVVDYLKERLDMTDSQTKVFSMKHPPVMRVKVAKLKEMIDFLYSEGFTPNQIYHTPRILCHSIITIQERLKELRALNHEPHSLLILCKSKRSFHKFLLSIGKDKRS